jgi:hypothetical protein
MKLLDREKYQENKKKNKKNIIKLKLSTILPNYLQKLNKIF